MAQENWIHEENASNWRKQALALVAKRNRWEKGRKKEIVKVDNKTIIIHYEKG